MKFSLINFLKFLVDDDYEDWIADEEEEEQQEDSKKKKKKKKNDDEEPDFNVNLFG